MTTVSLRQSDRGDPSANTASTSSNVIRPIPSTDVHRITSGQVVLDLQTAVKELIENALDASATNITINFRDYGAESFEVIDNGTGIDPSNYASVALKHYTSKLSSFSDLALVRTFGFRGEALSSLCALAKVTIHTATSEQAPMGTILQLDRGGRVESDAGRAARQRGTTITIEGLFKTLPVRRKEFEKNLKREYAKAQNLLQAYALITKGVRWTTTNTPASGRKTPQFSVNSSSAYNYLSANVSALFGAKVAPTLMPLNLELTFSVARARNKYLQSVARQSEQDTDGEEEKEETSTVTVVGLISKPVYGSGRTSSDRQFFYINGRPWEAGRVSRAFNEVYKSFNSNHFPFVIADFRLPTDSYDVNVSPDKRTIFLHEESRLIEKVKEALDELFAPSRATFLVNGASHSLRNGNGITSLSAQSKLSSFTSTARRSSSAASPEEVQDDREEEVAGWLGQADDEEDQNHNDEEDAAGWIGQGDDEDLDSMPPPLKISASSKENDLEYREESDSPALPLPRRAADPMDADDGSELDVPAPLAPEVDSSARASSKRDYEEVLDTSQASWSPSKKPRTAQSPPAPSRSLQSPSSDRSRSEARNVLASLRTFALPGSQMDNDLPVSSRMAAGEEEAESTPMAIEHEVEDSSTVDEEEEKESAPALEAAEEAGLDVPTDEDKEPLLNRLAAMQQSSFTIDDDVTDEAHISFDLTGLQKRLQARKGAVALSAPKSVSQSLPASGDEELLQGAGVSNQDKDQVEQALSRVIHKEDLSTMEVVGQFNVGFIIARRRTDYDDMDDLFIVDQHASDEKYNFETLQLTTTIRSQKLISPRSLELSASDELVAIEHQDTLLANGFEISVSETGLPGTRVKLVAQPISKSTVFGVKDLEELFFLLRDTSAGSEAARRIRCSKARNMFASRACRKSIMIGTALNKAKMSAILRNMGTIEQPWNCPHGRPTMRHLACLKTIGDQGRGEGEDADPDPQWNELVRCLG